MISVIFVLLATTMAPAETITIGFDDVAKLVSERNQHVIGADLQRRSALAGRGHLSRSFLPRLGLRAASENYKTGSQGSRSEYFGAVEAKVNLYKGGRDRLEDDIVDAKAMSASYHSDEVVRDEIKNGRQAFWHIVALREMTTLLEEAKLENRRNQKAAQDRIRAGLATDTDRIDFEMYQVALEQDLARTNLAAENTERELAILLGLPENSKVKSELIVSHDHSDVLLEESFDPQNHPAVATLSVMAQESNLERKRLSRWWIPSLDAYMGYSLYTFRDREYSLQSERFEANVGVQLSFELFDGLEARTEASQKALQAQGLKAEYEQSARELKAAIESSKAALKLTHTLIHQSEESLKRANTYLLRTLDEYRRGVKNSPDVLSASERNMQMKRRFAELRRDYQLARVDLLSIIGK